MGRLSLFSAVLFCAVVATYSSQHSLFYIYTALSKPLDLPGIYEFTALGSLDDRLLDYYDSVNQVKVPKQTWMKEKMEKDYWVKGTESRKSKEQWFKVNVEILMDRMRHNKSHLHVLQWRHGCVVDEGTDGKLTFLRGVDEYSYDGSEFLSFDEENSRWIAPVQAAEPTKKKWDEVAILNQYTKGYLEKECVGWLEKFMDYGKEQLRQHSAPKVHIFAKKSGIDPNKVTLTCLATGFLPPDARMYLRKSRTSLPDHLVKSSGIVPNGDGTYQLKSHTNIVKDTTVVYDCYVTHSALETPIIEEWVFEEDSGNLLFIIIGVVVVLVVVAVLIAVFFVLKKKGKLWPTAGGSENRSLQGSSNQGSNQSSTENIRLNGNAEDQNVVAIPDNQQPMLANNAGGGGEA